MISADALFTTQYASTASAIGTPCSGHAKVPIVPPRGLVHQARCLCRGNDGDDVEERPAEPMRALVNP